MTNSSYEGSAAERIFYIVIATISVKGNKRCEKMGMEFF